MDGFALMTKINMDKTLIILVGLPFSGKTTKALSMGCPIVSPDGVRLAIHGRNYCPEAEGLVWTMMRFFVLALFSAGHSHIILDGTNLKRRRRDQWINPKWQRKFLVSPMDAYECQQCADRVGDTALREQLKEAINRMVVEYEEVDEMAEGEIIPWDHAGEILCRA